jgi:glutathione S-transferase
MKLYYCPWACSLADHIALRESGLPFELERVDLKTRLTETGADFRAVSAKGYVPALILDNGEMLTENVAVLDWIATQAPALSAPGPLGRTRVLEALTYITTEIHGSFKPMWHGASPADLEKARVKVAGLLAPVAGWMKGDYLFGEAPSVADFYLFVMLLWAERFGVATPVELVALRDRIRARPAAQTALRAEGMLQAA